MKSPTLLPIFLLLLSTIIVSHLPSATAATAADVLDTDGDKMRNGGSYYLLPALRGHGGADLAKTGNETCPLTIAQASSEDDDGKPVIIASPYSTAISHFINEDSPLYLSFAPVPECAPRPSEWTVVNGIPGVSHALKITGYNTTESGSFFIKKSSWEDYYMLTFCHIPIHLGSCSRVGVRHVDENGPSILALVAGNEQPFLVRFKKAGFSSGYIEKA